MFDVQLLSGLSKQWRMQDVGKSNTKLLVNNQIFHVFLNQTSLKTSSILFYLIRCPFIDDYSYWTGDYCDVKVKQPFDLEKFKMIIAISVLGELLSKKILGLITIEIFSNINLDFYCEPRLFY